MHDNNTDKIMEDSLRSFFRKNRYYDADELYKAISEKKQGIHKAAEHESENRICKVTGYV